MFEFNAYKREMKQRKEDREFEKKRREVKDFINEHYKRNPGALRKKLLRELEIEEGRLDANGHLKKGYVYAKDGSVVRAKKKK